jgi:UDP-N-acetylglucosamine--N-acetylmuramyl-(pentapeptide) pyrophosphoryl-undecaprenol N-acetylglucosamine transferase
MKVVVVGGGSGGHVTPVVAVLKELKRQTASLECQFWCDRAFGAQANNIVQAYDPQIPVVTISSGKLRRYHTLPLWRHIVDLSIFLPNVRDFFLVLVGFVQSVIRLLRYRPDVVFAKGGYVCLPVGYAAALLGIPLVIHDSDAHPGLTNRLLSKKATFIATGSPLEYYSYPKQKSFYVGIPVDERFSAVEPADIQTIEQTYHLDAHRPLVVVTGGGLGARNINNAVLAQAPELVKYAQVILITGANNYAAVKEQADQQGVTKLPGFQLVDFVSQGMAALLARADIVVARAGATTLLELAALKKPSIIIPNAMLTGGHQVKNAKVYSDANAAAVLKEDTMLENSALLTKTIVAMLGMSPASKRALGERFYKFARPHAAADVAKLIVAAATHQQVN